MLKSNICFLLILTLLINCFQASAVRADDGIEIDCSNFVGGDMPVDASSPEYYKWMMCSGTNTTCSEADSALIIELNSVNTELSSLTISLDGSLMPSDAGLPATGLNLESGLPNTTQTASLSADQQKLIDELTRQIRELDTKNSEIDDEVKRVELGIEKALRKKDEILKKAQSKKCVDKGLPQFNLEIDRLKLLISAARTQQYKNSLEKAKLFDKIQIIINKANLTGGSGANVNPPIPVTPAPINPITVPVVPAQPIVEDPVLVPVAEPVIQEAGAFKSVDSISLASKSLAVPSKAKVIELGSLIRKIVRQEASTLGTEDTTISFKLNKKIYLTKADVMNFIEIFKTVLAASSEATTIEIELDRPSNKQFDLTITDDSSGSMEASLITGEGQR